MKSRDISVADIQRVREKAIDDYWAEYYINEHLCSLCGNSGIIDTRTTAISGAHVNAGRLNFCICPNGRAMRESGAPINR